MERSDRAIRPKGRLSDVGFRFAASEPHSVGAPKQRTVRGKPLVFPYMYGCKQACPAHIQKNHQTYVWRSFCLWR